MITKDFPRYGTARHATLATVAAELLAKLSELAAFQRGVLSRVCKFWQAA